jgi:predicted hydrocarbon binding protein
MVQVKDKLAAWYVQKFVISKAQVFDNPGFIIFKLTGAVSFYSRQLILPEELFVNLEKQLFNLGPTGQQMLYTLGKKFGYRFALVSNLKTFSEIDSVEFKNYVYSVVRFVEGTYSTGIEHDFDVNKKILNMSMKDFVICSESGVGLFLSAGGIAGIWAKLIGDKSVEGVHYACQGNGESMCKVIVGQPEFINNFSKNIISESDLENLELSPDYIGLNEVCQIQNSTKSFQMFLDSKACLYRGGIIQMKNNRFFIIEASIIYLIEQVLSKNIEAMDIFKQVAFDMGKKLFIGMNLSYLIDFLSAFGFGDPYVIKKNNSFLVNIDYFPWTRFVNQSKHVFLSNFISGALSEISAQNINLKINFSGFQGKGYSITLS